MSKNTEYLKGMACPMCGSQKPFRAQLDIRIGVLVRDHGWVPDRDQDIFEEKINRAAWMQCCGCQYASSASAFVVSGAED